MIKKSAFTLFIVLCFLFGNAQAQNENKSLQNLIDGNNRFISGQSSNLSRDMERVHELAHEQHPYAIIVSCSDSRVPPEIIFDAGLGNLFEIRLAGQVIDKYALGSIEYAAKHLGTQLIVVLGHSNCGAVHAAIEPKDYGININSIVEKITPAVEKARLMEGDLVQNSVKENVRLVKSEIENAPELKKLIEAGTIHIVSGVYNLENGKVEFND